MNKGLRIFSLVVAIVMIFATVASIIFALLYIVDIVDADQRSRIKRLRFLFYRGSPTGRTAVAAMSQTEGEESPFCGGIVTLNRNGKRQLLIFR